MSLKHKRCIFVSGLPASGKTSLARALADAVGFSFFDKDDYLEALYEQRGIGDADWRQQLSRASDLMFQQHAVSAHSAVLVSHWRAPHDTGQSGSSTQWVSNTFAQIVHIYCCCPPQIAARRFSSRRRHPGHLDQQKSSKEALEWMFSMAAKPDWQLGYKIKVNTGKAVSLPPLIKQIEQHFFGLSSSPK